MLLVIYLFIFNVDYFASQLSFFLLTWHGTSLRITDKKAPRNKSSIQLERTSTVKLILLLLDVINTSQTQFKIKCDTVPLILLVLRRTALLQRQFKIVPASTTRSP